MVYLYKKTAGLKNYYYLRASERKGKRILAKDIAYLGNTIEEARKSLNNLPQYTEEIRKAYKTLHRFLESNHFLEQVKESKLKRDIFLKEKQEEIEACKLHFNSTFQHNPEPTKKEIWKNFLIEFAFNTASIEGNTIRLDQARDLLQEGLTPENKTVREIYDLQNTEKVFFEVLHLKEEISHELIIRIHAGLMENIDSRKGYRTVDVRVIHAHFQSTPAPYVKTDMDLLLEWYAKYKEKLHPFVLAVVFHHKFEKIHPFMDGNGRTGRMLLNYILLNHLYPPVIVHRKQRTEYLNALGKADKVGLTALESKSYLPLMQFIIQEMIDEYWNLFL